MSECRRCGKEHYSSNELCNECTRNQSGAASVHYCTKCGEKLSEGSAFCQKCGASAHSNAVIGGPSHYTPQHMGKPYPYLSNKWVWTLACAPLLSSIILGFMFSVMYINNATEVSFVIPLIINCILLLLDGKELKQNGIETGKWLWMGLILVPVYMFMRAGKTNKEYSYAILWCVFFALSIFI